MYFELFLFCSICIFIQRVFTKPDMPVSHRICAKTDMPARQKVSVSKQAGNFSNNQASIRGKQYAAVWTGLLILWMLFRRRTFSVTQLLWICAAVCLIFCIRLLVGAVCLVLPFRVLPFAALLGKATAFFLVFYTVLLFYWNHTSAKVSEELDGEEVLFFFLLLSALFVFSGKIKAVLEASGSFGFFSVLAGATPVWGFYLIERVRGAGLDELGWMYVTGNILLLALLYGCLYFVLPYKKLAAGIFLTGCLVFGLANYYVSQFKGNPVMPNDLLSLNTAFQVAGGYEFQITEPVITGILHWYTSLGLLCSLPGWNEAAGQKENAEWKKSAGRKKGAGWKVRAAAGSLAAFLCMYGIFSLDFERLYGLDAIDQWAVNIFYNTKGSVLGFAELVKKLKLEEPDGYSRERAQELLKAGGHTTKEETGGEKTGTTQEKWQPTLIAIMDESFSDLRSLGDFTCSKEYLEEWYAVEDFACKGTLYVSTYGGGTANSEFEFLTGNSIANCASGTVPYQIYDLKNVGNLAGILKNDGYRASAIHPQYKGNWNRMRTYANFGFDDFLGIEDFENPRYVRSFVSDESSFDKVIELYERHSEKQFIFNVTMQNHGGYNIEEMAQTQCIRLKKEWEQYTDVETYLTLMQESDQAVRGLLDYFKNVDEPVIICIFGDHHPAVNAEWIEEVMGKPQEGLSLQDAQRKYAVPYMIWANFDTPYVQCEMDTSANYLGALFLENAGLRQSAYTDFLTRMRKEIPVLNALGYQTKDGEWHTLDEEDAGGWIRDYRIVQYYAMFDESRLQEYFQ
ncbi:MAG: LTA synthase family protein [Eubacterium sp.]|nr:LTA synthase family protein [Eubacterium sp.]